jgi:serine/threonine protein kinase/tetratricopeptide (TPR) repeat protein
MNDPQSDATTFRLDTAEQEKQAAEARTIAVAAPVPGVALGEQAGDQIGRYKLIEELGEGGFGTVWRAEQSEPIQREVALKVIKPGMDSREIIARFAKERQTLALMEHPNIAAVLDAGATEGGRPFFVMELVKGVPITSYCDAKKLTIRERMELFIPVCQAVQHAHQKAVLHRDLKPSNILVMELDGKAVPKVIDFGIAKALGGPEEQAASLVRTQAGMVIGTPQYMSPEQAGSRADVDTRSDIYTLGIILYELLTGQTPLTREQIKSAALDEMLRLIREGEAKKPSSSLLPASEVVTRCATQRRSDPKRLTAAMRGDLDWIVLKALEKERERRYETATALAEDIRRYLQSEPVSAAAPSAGYRLRKLLRKHRAAFAAAFTLFVVLTAGVVISTWQAARASRAESLANTRLELVTAEKLRADEQTIIATAINEFLQKDLLLQADSTAQANRGFTPEPGLTMRQALDRASQTIGERFRELPLAEASIRDGLGRSYLAVGSTGSSVSHLRTAVAIRTEALGVEHPDTLSSRAALAASLLVQGQHDEAEMEQRAIVEIRRRALGPEHRDTLGSRNNLANAMKAQGRYAEALAEYRGLLEIQEHVLGPQDQDVFSVRSNLAGLLDDMGDHAGAEAEYKKLLGAQQAKLGPEHPDVMIIRNNLGLVYQNMGKYAAADAEHRAVLAIQTRVLGPTHPDTLASRMNLALAMRNQEKFREAEAEYRSILAIQEKITGPDHPRTLVTRNGLAWVLKSLGRMEESEAETRLVIEKMSRILGPGHPDTLGSRNGLAELLRVQGKHAEAEKEQRALIQVMTTTLGAENPSTLGSRFNLAEALRNQGRVQEAAQENRAVLEARRRVLPAGHPDIFFSCANLAVCLWALQQGEEAIGYMKQAEEGLGKSLGAENSSAKLSRTLRQQMEQKLTR